MRAVQSVRQQRFVGTGTLQRIDEVPEFFEARSILLVHGRRSFAACGAAGGLHAPLEHRNVHRFCDFGPNPTLEVLQRGLQQLAGRAWDVIIAVGGGTALDLGKLLAACAAAPEESVRCIREGRTPAAEGVVPVIAIPTTAGSGSEATHFAVVYVDGVKHSVAHAALLPVAAIVDSRLSASMPPQLTAVSGMDALTQAIESHWSVKATRQTQRWSRRAVRLVLRHLVTAVNDPRPEDRAGMAEAAHLAGRAINVTQTTACHALSYPMTARWGVPHGLAVALTLGAVYRYNHGISAEDTADRRGAAHLRRAMTELDELLGLSGARQAGELVRELLESVGLPASLSAAGIAGGEGQAAIAAAVDPSRLANNPRPLSAEALRFILSES